MNNKIKIINGKYKNSNILFKNKFNIRPTKSIIKKSLFGIIEKHINKKKCLDLFAGSGSLGIESISLGAKEVFFIEKKKRIARNIKRNLLRIGIKKKYKVINKDYKDFIKENSNKKFDIIFIDPPYKKNKEKIINRSINILSEGGIIYIESQKNSNKQDIKKIKNKKRIVVGKKGKTMYSIIFT